jgi:hypothetical protein
VRCPQKYDTFYERVGLKLDLNSPGVNPAGPHPGGKSLNLPGKIVVHQAFGHHGIFFLAPRFPDERSNPPRRADQPNRRCRSPNGTSLFQTWINISRSATLRQVATHILKLTLPPARRTDVRGTKRLQGRTAVTAFPIQFLHG